jgi:cyclophilin family peptidyl-prolyl cis-trans isomerase
MRLATASSALCLLLPVLLAGCTDPPPPAATCTSPGFVDGTSRVNITTNKGSFVVELYGDKAPNTVCNFLRYVDEKFYDNTCFHRIIPGFVVQGGGMATETCGRAEKETHAPIAMENSAKLQNDLWTLAMARTSDPNSATSQFYINTVDNCALDSYHWSECPENAQRTDPSGNGYAVFGKVVSGTDVVKALESKGTSRGTPTELVYIQTARLVAS